VGALDGLRGLAVTAVVVNHLRPNALPGGWLGVDVFFVLSGYLITSLLLAEHAETGRIELRRFYSRRARRLLPAVFLLLVVLAVVARLAPGAAGFANLKGDGFAALGYVANWHLVLTRASYFGAFAPSPLRHLWSLSVEEQFYLVWPLVLVVVLRRRGPRAVGLVALGLALASATAMAVAYGNGSNISRVYFGTDTHAHGVLIGCVLAVMAPARRRWPLPRIGALVALVGVGFACAALSGTGATAYRGGVAGAGVLTAVVIAGVVAPGRRGPVGWLLELRPLRTLGRISYGVYLWHWPVLVFVTAQRVGASGWPLLGLQVALTLALAAGSYVVLERPVQIGWPRPRWSWVAVPAAATAVGLTMTLVVPTVAAPFALAQQDARERNAAIAPLPRGVGARALGSSAPAGPHRVVVIGDSVAYTLFPGLQEHERASNLYFLTAAQTGCPLDIAATAYGPVDAPQPPVELPRYCQWPQVWPAMIERTRPDVVVALWGLWDLYDHEVGGRWLTVGSPAWAAHMEQTLERALTIVTAHGARLIVLTTPYLFTVAKHLVNALNRVYRVVAARHPDQLTVVDIEPAVRESHAQRWDSVHWTAHGADVLGRIVTPLIARAAHATTRVAPGEL
jgi:peptidoglycan/LPS O-acetylase OafA/YrhL